MGGQDGYQRDMLTQNTDSWTALMGVRFRPSKSFDLGINATQTKSTQSLDPFDLPAPDYVATHPSTSFDFSNAHLYSVIDVNRLDVTADANIKFNSDFWMNLYYRYSDYQDNYTMLDDLSGTAIYFGAYLGWAF